MFAVQADGRKLTTIEGLAQPDGKPGALQDAFCEAHATQCGYCTPGMLIAAHALLEKPAPTEHEIREAIGGNLCRCTGYQQIVDAIKLAAGKTWRRTRHRARSAENGFRYIGKKRRTKEDPRFVTGCGRFVADIALPGMKHVALVSSPHAAARIKSIRTDKALALTGVHYVLTGAELCAAVEPLLPGVDAPKVARYPLAHGVVRYAGEWVAAVVAETRALAEDAAERSKSTTQPTDTCARPGEGRLPVSAAGASRCMAANILHRQVRLGTCGRGFRPRRAQAFLTRALGPQRDGADRNLWRRGAVGSGPADARCVGFDPDAEIPRPVGARAAPAGQRGASAFRRRCRRQFRRQARHQAYGAGRISRATNLGMPVRLIEDRLENMRGGDMHGPDRIFDMQLAFDADGTIRSLRIRALDDVGAYAGRSPLQLGKPVGAIVGPYQIHSVEYEPISVMTNKTAQEAVRGFGQSPTNYAMETAIDRVARHLGMDRIALRKRNFIRKDQFPYLIPSGTQLRQRRLSHGAGQGARGRGFSERCRRARDAARKRGAPRRHRHFQLPRAFRRQFRVRAAVQSEERDHHLDGFLPGARRPVRRHYRRDGHLERRGRVTRLWLPTVLGEVLERDPDAIRVVHADSLNALPSNSPVGSRMAIMLGGAAAGAARKIKAALLRDRRA